LSMADESEAGVGQFKYIQEGMEPFRSETVYLEKGNLRTFMGDVISKGDVIAQRKLKINAMNFYGEGTADLFYVAQGSGKYSSSSLYVSSSVATEVGSIESKKDLVTNRFLRIGTGDAKTTDGGGDLWYCNKATSGESEQNRLYDKSLYLQVGNFLTQKGSIYAEKDLVATRELYLGSSGDAFENVKSARARLWYAQKDSGDVFGETLYLKEGSFGTSTGNVISPENLVADQYVSIGAMEGYGMTSQDEMKMFYSSKQTGPEVESVLYVKKGDFRVQAGTIYSTDLSAAGSVKLSAMQGHGAGDAAFFYVDTPTAQALYQPKSLYVKAAVDFRAENIFSATHLIATQGVKIEAKAGFGNGQAEFWFGKKGGEAGALDTATFAPDTMYLRDGTFSTQTGDLHAHLDVETMDGAFKIAAKLSPKSSMLRPEVAELWYASTGVTPSIASKSLYLRKGNFGTLTGSIGASKNVRAHPQLGTLKAPKVRLTGAMKCTTCEFKKIYILPQQQQKTASPHEKPPLISAPDTGARSKALPHALSEAFVLLDEASGGNQMPVIDLEVALHKMQQHHQDLRTEQESLIDMLSKAKQGLAELERQVR